MSVAGRYPAGPFVLRVSGFVVAEHCEDPPDGPVRRCAVTLATAPMTSPRTTARAAERVAYALRYRGAAARSVVPVQYPRRLAHGPRTPAMCLLALFFRMVEDAPLVAGANREEAYA